MAHLIKCRCGARLWATASKVITRHHCPLGARADRRLEETRARVAARTTAAAIDPREFTAFAGPDRPVFGPILRGIASSPIGAMWGLALLFLLWLSGCA